MLQCLRYHDKDRILWIDEICIDRSNAEERSQQVQMMSAIFGLADSVVFWLGKPTAEATLLMNSLTDYENRCLQKLLIRKSTSTDKFPWRGTWSEVQKDLELYEPDLIARQQKGLQTLLKRRWFKSIWTLQEVAKAQSAVIQCGRLSVPAHIFARGISLLDTCVEPYVQTILDIVPESIRKDSSWIQKNDLFSLVVKFSEREAIDERDFIYALVGISSEPRTHDLLTIDYTNSLLEVMDRTIRYWFGATSLSPKKVLRLLASFKHLHVTCFVWPLAGGVFEGLVHGRLKKTEISMKIREGLQYVGNEFWILIERDAEGMSTTIERCYTELDKLLSRSDHSFPPGEGPGHVGFWLAPGEEYERGITFAVVQDEEQALNELSSNQCTQTFNIIADQIKGKRQEVLNGALYKAVVSKNENGVRLLLAKGADANAEGSDNDGILWTASQTGHGAIVRMLLDHSSNIEASEPKHSDIVSQEVSLDDDSETSGVRADQEAQTDSLADRIGRDALEVALESGHTDIVKMLLDKDVFDAGKAEYTSWLLRASRNGHGEIVQILLDQGADVNTILGSGTPTALQIAARGGHTDIVQMLLQRDANVNAPEHVGYGTALYEALDNCHTEIARLLLDRSAVVESRRFRTTALQVASRKGSKELVQMLIDRGESIDAQGEEDDTALQEACSWGNTEIVRTLIQNGADVNIQGGRFGTALHAAADYGDETIVHLLVNADAKLNVRDDMWGTPLSVALNRGHEDTVRMLREAGGIEWTPDE